MAANGTLYGIIGALGVVVTGGGLYIAQQNGAFGPTATTSAVTAPAPSPVPAPAPAITPPPQSPKVIVVPPAQATGPTAAQRDQVRQLVSDARRAITRGDFGAADRALDQAERLDPGGSDVIAARRDLHDAQQQANRDNRKVDGLVVQARAAIARHDYAAADRLLDQAEGIDRSDRDVQQARAELNAAQRPAPDHGPSRR